MTRTTNCVLRFLADERPELPARLEIFEMLESTAWMDDCPSTCLLLPSLRAENPRAGGNSRSPRPSPMVALRCHLPTLAIGTKVSPTMHFERMALWSTPC